MFSLDKYNFYVNESDSKFINVYKIINPSKIEISFEFNTNQKCLVFHLVKLAMASIIYKIENKSPRSNGGQREQKNK